MDAIPIIIDGEECGEVRFRREGAYMICQGEARWSGGILRLWLYGSGAPGYLGVLIPDGKGGAALRKRFTLAEYSRLPNPATYCATEEIRSKEPPTGPTDTPERLWVASPDGTLTHWENGRRYVAFPTDRVRLPRGGEFLLHTIEGRQYVIFPG